MTKQDDDGGPRPGAPVAPARAPRPVPDGSAGGRQFAASAALPGTAASRPRIMPQPASLRSRNGAEPGWARASGDLCEMAAASRRSLALGLRVAFRFAACARESSGWNWRSLSQPRFPGSLQRSEAEWKAIRDPAQELAKRRLPLSFTAVAQRRTLSRLALAPPPKPQSASPPPPPARSEFRNTGWRRSPSGRAR